MKARIISIGKFKQEAYKSLFDEFAKRLKGGLELIELQEAKGEKAIKIGKEADMLLNHCQAGYYRIALDAKGVMLDSIELAHHLEPYQNQGINILIGGADGLDPRILQHSDFTLSLGKLIWPHLLVRVMIAEQLYRAHSILTHHPYHRTH